REELREQLPDLFAGRGAVVVYATSEPEEALLLGGYTALMDDGRVTQFGPTADIYRNPANLTAARVFSDPPINAASVTKTGETVTLEGTASWSLQGDASGLPDGRYMVAVRPHRVTPMRQAAGDIELKGDVLVTELSGSDSSAHFRIASADWVSLAPGVHPYRVGEQHSFFMNPDHCRYFGEDGQRVA
ncbi:MAG: TOBE domain-containing protein, partial [Pseudomonadota bacterium]